MQWRLFVLICFVTLIFTNGCKNTVMLNIEEQKIEQSTKLTIEVVNKLLKKGAELSWEDFQTYSSKDIGSGLYIKLYPINDTYELLIGGGSLKKNPMYISLTNKDTKKSIDIRYDNIDKFIK